MTSRWRNIGGYAEHGTEADDLGQFAFDGLLAGDHRLALELPHQLVVTPWVPIRPRFPFDHPDLATALGLTIPDCISSPTHDDALLNCWRLLILSWRQAAKSR